MREAAQVDKDVRAGKDKPLAGVPLAVKDLYETKGVHTTAGSKLLADNVPDHDATAAARLRQAGMFFTATQYLSAQQARRRIIAEWSEIWRDIDCLITPTVPIPATKIGAMTTMLGGENARSCASTLTRCCPST